MTQKSCFGRITGIRVRNFCGLTDVNVSLEPITVFVGMVGTGKSSLINALRFVRDLMQDSVNRVVEKHGGDRLFYTEKEYPSPSFFIGLSMAKENGWQATYEIEVAKTEAGYRIAREMCDVCRSGQSDSFCRDGEYSDRVFLADCSETSFGLLYDTLANMRFYDIHPEVVGTTNEKFPLREDGGNLGHTLAKLSQTDPKSLELIERYLRASVYGANRIRVLPGHVMRVQIGYGESDDVIVYRDLYMESEGIRYFVGLYSALFHHKYSVFCSEHPERYSDYEGYQCLMSAIEIAIRAGYFSQAIITTKQPDFLDYVSAEQIRVVDKSEEGKAVVAPLIDYQKRAVENNLFAPSELYRIEGLRPQVES